MNNYICILFTFYNFIYKTKCSHACTFHSTYIFVHLKYSNNLNYFEHRWSTRCHRWATTAEHEHIKFHIFYLCKVEQNQNKKVYSIRSEGINHKGFLSVFVEFSFPFTWIYISTTAGWTYSNHYSTKTHGYTSPLTEYFSNQSMFVKQNSWDTFKKKNNLFLP